MLTSLIVPGSNIVPFSGGSFKISTNYADDDLQLQFKDIETDSFVEQSNTNVSLSLDGFRIEPQLANAVYSVEAQSLFQSIQSYAVVGGFTFTKTKQTATDVKPYVVEIQDLNGNYLRYEFVYNDSSAFVLRVSKDINGDTASVDYGITDTKISFVIVKNGSNFYFYIVRSDSFEQIDASNLTLQTNTKWTFSYSDPEISGVAKWDDVSFIPVVTGLKSDNGSFSTFDLPIPYRKEGNSLFYSAKPNMPGNYSVSLSGLGQFSAEEDLTFALSVRDFDVTEDDLKLCVSPVGGFNSDADAVTLCPVFGVSDSDNRGTLNVSNVCFCDGSSRDGSELQIVGGKFGFLDSDYDKLDFPDFFFNDGVNTYGHCFEFKRLYQLEPSMSLTFASLGQRIGNLRTLVLPNKDRFYYGVNAAEGSNQDIRFDLTYGFSPDQLAAGLGTAIDQFYWEVLDERDNVVSSPTNFPIDSTNYTAAGNIPGTQNLAPGRYTLKIMTLKTLNRETSARETFNQGAVIEAEVYEVDGFNSYLINKGIAEGEAVSTVDSENPVNLTNPKEYGVCYINFSVGAKTGSLVTYYHDICSGTIQKQQQSSFGINILTDSVSAIDHGDKVIVFYKSFVGNSIFDTRSQTLSFVVFDKATNTYSDSGEFHFSDLRNDEFIHCFDCYRDGDKLYFYLGVGQDVQRINIDTVPDENFDFTERRTVPFTPIGRRGLVCMEFDISKVTFTQDDYLLTKFEKNLVNLNAIESFLLSAGGFTFAATGEGNGGYTTKYGFPGFVRVNYNNDIGLATVSVLDENTRWCVHLLGKGLTLKETAIPMPFDTFEIRPTRVEYGFSDFRRLNTGIDSVSSVLGNDGMIYSIFSRQSIVEMGISDSEPYFNNKSSLVVPILVTDDDFELYLSKYRNESYTLLGRDDEGKRDKIMVDLVRDHQYLVACFSSNRYSRKLNVYQNGFADIVPFETSSEIVWTPEYQGVHSNEVDFNVVYDNDKANLQNVQTGGSSLKLVLDETNTYKNAFFYLDRGYKFHARFSVTQGLTEPLIFAQKSYVGSGDDNLEAPYYNFETRVRVFGDTAICEYFDDFTSGWTALHTFTSVPAGVIDWYMIVQQTDEEKMKCAFAYKKPQDISDFESLARTTYSYSVQADNFESFIDVRGTDSVQDEFTEFGLSFLANGVTDRAEFCNIYQLGYNTVSLDFGNRESKEVDKGVSPITVYDSKPYAGSRFKQFNDAKLFLHNKSEPDYGYKVWKDNSMPFTSSYHWYNGFSFKFSGENMYTDDVIYLQRETINNLANLSPKQVHGTWYTANDSSTVHIWADAQESGLEKFFVDTFFATGCNVPEIKIVARDSEEDPWLEYGSLDFSRYKTENSQTTIHSVGTSFSYVFSRSFVFDKSFSERPMYIYDDTDSLDAGRVNSFYGDNMVFDVNSTPFNSNDLTVFDSKSSVKLDTPINKRYVGFRVNAFNTKEGYFTFNNLDFGYSYSLPLACNYDRASSVDYGFSYEVVYASSGQAVYNNNELVSKEYSLTYSILDSDSFLTFMSLFDQTALSSKPFWVHLDQKNKRQLFDLCFFEDQIGFNNIVDEDGDNIFSVELNFKSVGEI